MVWLGQYDVFTSDPPTGTSMYMYMYVTSVAEYDNSCYSMHASMCLQGSLSGVHLEKSPRGGRGKNTLEDILSGRAYSEQYSILKQMAPPPPVPPPRK